MAKQKPRKHEGPCFYTIMLPTNLIVLRIPTYFKHHLSNMETDSTTLKTPCGNWVVKLLKNDKSDVYFSDGWQAFVKHHSLVHVELLVFKYDDKDMSFDVVIYDKNGCKKNYQSIKTTHQETEPCFASSYPYFRHVMKETNVGKISSLHIPAEFQRQYIPLSRQNFILRNSKGISWPVTITVCGNKFISIVRGWKIFSDDNSIEKEDVCIFELVEQNTMQVHIFKYKASVPCFRHVVKEYNVGTGSTMLIPKGFQQKYLPLSKQIITLRNSEGNCWLVKTSISGNKLLTITGGWKAFADANSVKKGDVCIFELVEQNTIQVKIIKHD